MRFLDQALDQTSAVLVQTVIFMMVEVSNTRSAGLWDVCCSEIVWVDSNPAVCEVEDCSPEVKAKETYLPLTM